MNKKCRDNSVEFRDKKDNESAVADLLKKGERPKTFRSDRSKPLFKIKACLLACLLACRDNKTTDQVGSCLKFYYPLHFHKISNQKFSTQLLFHRLLQNPASLRTFEKTERPKHHLGGPTKSQSSERKEALGKTCDIKAQ